MGHTSHTNYLSSDFRPNSANNMATIRPSWIRSVSHFAHWYIRWLSTSLLFIMHINYDHGSHKLWMFSQIQQRKMAASRPSGTRSISNFAHWYSRWLSTSFHFIMYINYDHGSHKLWMFWFSTKFSKEKWSPVGHLRPINLKFCTLLHYMIVCKSPIHYV